MIFRLGPKVGYDLLPSMALTPYPPRRDLVKAPYSLLVNNTLWL